MTIVLDPIARGDQLSRVGTALVGMANLEPAVARWAFEFAEDVPRFEVSGAGIDGAATLYASVGGQDRVRAFIYPPAFAPLLADAMASLGAAAGEAAAVAWDLPLRDTLEATAALASTDSVYRREWVAHEYAAIRRTNAAVRTVARLLGVRAPANLDLSLAQPAP